MRDILIRRRNIKGLLIRAFILTAAIVTVDSFTLPQTIQKVYAEEASQSSSIYSVTTMDDFISKMNAATDGDVIRLAADIKLTTATHKFVVKEGCLVTLDLNGHSICKGNDNSGVARDWIGVQANSALLIKNGTIEKIDTNQDDAGVLILNNVKVKKCDNCTSGITGVGKCFLGRTQTWIVNNCYISLLNNENAKVNEGASNLNPITTASSYQDVVYNYENSAPAMVGSGVTWKCLSTLQEDFSQLDGTTYKYVYLLQNSTLTSNTVLSKAGTIIDFAGYTLTEGAYSFSFSHTAGAVTLRNGKLVGTLNMDSSNTGNVVITQMEITGNVSNGAHPLAINGGKYNNITCGDAQITITDGYYAGQLSGKENYEITGGKFVNEPSLSKVKTGYKVESISQTADGTTYHYQVVPHTHNAWNYQASGNTITATCVASGKCDLTSTYSITLVPTSSSNYSDSGGTISWREEQVISFSLEGEDDWKQVLGSSSLPEINYEGTGSTTYTKSTTKPAVEGTYKATITKGTATAAVNFRIKKILNVSFNANGGKGSMASTEVEKGQYTLPTCTIKAPVNKEFGGWSLIANGTKVISPMNVTSNITLYAIWINHTHQLTTKNLGNGMTKVSCGCGFYIIKFD